MKKNKLIYSVALAVPAAFALSPIISIPSSALAETTAPSVTDVVYTVNSQNVSISYDDFSSAFAAGVLTDLEIKFVKLSNSKYYDFTTFTSAFIAFGSLEATTTQLDKDLNSSTPLPNVNNGNIDTSTGNVIVGNNNPEVSTFRVTDIK